MSVRLGRGVAAAVVAAVVATGAFAASPPARVNVLVLKEHGVGGAALAQSYLDRFIALAAKQYGWGPDAHGQYHTTRAAAEAYIRDE